MAVSCAPPRGKRGARSPLLLLLVRVERRAASCLQCLGLGQFGSISGVFGTHALFKDGLLLVHVEFGLEVAQVIAEAARVGSASGIGKSKAAIDDFFTGAAPAMLG